MGCAQVSFSLPLCAVGQPHTPARPGTPHRARAAEQDRAAAWQVACLPACAPTAAPHAGGGAASLLPQAPYSPQPLQLWTGANTRQASVSSVSGAAKHGPATSRPACEAENAGSGGRDGQAQAALGDLVRRLTYERRHTADGCGPPGGTGLDSAVRATTARKRLGCSDNLHPLSLCICLVQAHRSGLEQDFRESYHNRKLARSWRAGAAWAALDFNGLELTAAAALAAEQRYAQARPPANSQLL